MSEKEIRKLVEWMQANCEGGNTLDALLDLLAEIERLRGELAKKGSD